MIKLSEQRRQDIRFIGILSVGIIVTTWFVARLASRAWAANGVLYRLGHESAAILGIGLHAEIAFIVGVPIAWVMLMLFDRSKRIQSPAIIAISIVFIGVLLSLGRLWVVDWGQNILPLLSGIVAGLVLGGWTSVFTSRIEFPVAAIGLYVLAIVLAVGSIIDAYVIGGWFRTGDTTLLGYVDAVLSFAAAVSFIALVGWFVRYRDQRRVVMLGSDSSGTAATTGLVRHIQSQFATHVIEGDGTIGAAAGVLANGHIPAPLTENVSLEYRSPELLSRWIRITAMPYDPHRDEFESINSSGMVANVIDTFVGPFREFIATKAGLQETPGHSASDADIVVFVLSMSDLLPAGIDPDNVDPWDLKRSDRVEAIEDLHNTLDRSIETVFAVYNGKDAYRVAGVELVEHELNSDDVVDMLKTHAFNVYPTKIVLLDLLDGQDLVTGADELRRQIDRRD